MCDEGHPRRQHYGKSRSVGDIGVEGAYFVFHKVRHPVLATAAANQTVVGECAGPFYIGTCLIVRRIGQSFGRFCHKSHQQSFRQTVGYFHTCGDRKITLHDVYHHIDNAYGGLFG